METTDSAWVPKVSPLTESFYREGDASSQDRINVQMSVCIDEDQSNIEEPEDSLPINNNKLVHEHPKYILNDEKNGAQRVYARLVGVGHELDHLMVKPRIVIGRNSSKGNVDINMGHSNFISRNHLEINYTNGQFYLSCGGKNGVFVEDHFQKIGALPLVLPKMCTLRFPSTQIMIRFSAMDSDDLMTSPPLSSLPHQSVQGLQVRIPSSRPSFFSPCPSPTGTISAVNSAPASPTSNNGAALFSIMNRRVTAPSSSKDDRIPIAGENDDIKPPYSYAQLIVQAISSAPDKQMTLSGIYSYISRNYSYYRAHDKGWQNSIRHNLSLNRYFLKIARSQEEPGKGCFWRIDPVSEPKLVAQAFRRRNKRGVPYFRGTPSALSTQSAPASPTRSSADDSLASPEPQSLSSSVNQPMSVITSSLMPHHVLNDIRAIQSAPGSPQGYKILSPASIITTNKDFKSVINLYQQPTTTTTTTISAVTTEQPAVTAANYTQQSGENSAVFPAHLPVQLLTSTNNTFSLNVSEDITSNNQIPTTIKHEDSPEDQEPEIPAKRARFPAEVP